MSVVFNLKDDSVQLIGGAERHGAAGRRKLDRVGQQIRKHLAQTRHADIPS